MSPTSRLVLPVEIYDEIIYFITSTKDLLNVALTCRQLCALIIPDHIDYRVVVCSTFDSFVWEHFLNNPRLAKRMHSIKLDDIKFHGTETGERRIIPRELQLRSMRQDDAELKGGWQLKALAFTKSILIMKDLYSFDHMGPYSAFLLFAYLSHCATGLRIFNRTNILSMINNLLENNHSLKSVTLFLWDNHFEFIPLPRFLLDANWSKIHTLALGGDFTVFEDDIDFQLRISQTQSFFSKHASLEKVRFRHLRNIPIYPGTIQPDMLPKLHTLDLDFEMVYPLSELIPENVLIRLVNLSANLSNVPDSFITSGHLKNIRRLYTKITSYDRIPLLLEAIPNIERLHVDFSTDRQDGDLGGIDIDIDFTKHSKYLTHLSLLFPSRAEVSAPEKYALELDKLEFIHFSSFTTAFNPWFQVIRSPSGTTSLERHREESDEWAQHLWMGFDSSFD
ncbi:hypothetical protein Clacol_005406 [Clathrus columnatus]|uniref:F-box domain-containing protein n=1 Tax=Clathrus columnatus TaxID=1419009 RepID=A0AAV5A982_9AGAM|nr:hypothetical protein Clacol_005406 [Clathrus columnatus]